MSGSDEESWQVGLCSWGEDGDCPRSCCAPCVQFGQTRHRLEQIEHGKDPLDLTGHMACNIPCWNYFCLCISCLYLGSGIYTGEQTRRVRKAFHIKGNCCGDVASGILCQPCSLIRNNHEIRQRARMNNSKNFEMAPGLPPPLPLGEENYRPIYGMVAADGYQKEPQMTTLNAPSRQSRELHYHQAVNGAGENLAVPLYPTEREIREHERY